MSIKLHCDDWVIFGKYKGGILRHCIRQIPVGLNS